MNTGKKASNFEFFWKSSGEKSGYKMLGSNKIQKKKDLEKFFEKVMCEIEKANDLDNFGKISHKRISHRRVPG